MFSQSHTQAASIIDTTWLKLTFTALGEFIQEPREATVIEVIQVIQTVSCEI